MPPAQAPTKILVDAASLARPASTWPALLLKSTGNQFQVATNAGVSPVKGAILLTTVNALTEPGRRGLRTDGCAGLGRHPRARRRPGVFYGVQSLLQLLPPQILAPQPVSGVQWTAPCVYIQDQPRFPWRGWMLDVVRHFFNKQEIKQLLDAMALHKLNTFHWHLVDDQGWRIEILQYPLLTQTGAWRNGIDWTAPPAPQRPRQHGLECEREVWRLLHAGRHPGDRRLCAAAAHHDRAGNRDAGPFHGRRGLLPPIQLQPQLRYSMDSINYTYDVYSPGTTRHLSAFLEDILTEVIGLFPGQYIHCGGDEVSSSIWT